MNGSLDSLVNNITCNLYNTNCKHFMKCKDCKKCEKCKDKWSEWCEMCNSCKKLSDFCKQCNKICEYCICLDKMEVGDQQFAFKCEKCKKIIAIPSEYHISKVLIYQKY